jgi:hypothetical protein
VFGLGEACLWWIDLKMARGRGGGGDTVWPGLGGGEETGSTGSLPDVDVSYAAPQAHIIVNVALHREYSPSIVFIFFPREE